MQVANMVTRLSTGDWFTAKVSACGLFTAAYKHITDADQRTLLRTQVRVLPLYTRRSSQFHEMCTLC